MTFWRWCGVPALLCHQSGIRLPFMRTLITACREVILVPEAVRQLHLVFKPQRRLEVLLRTFRWVFVTRSREPVGVVALSICIGRKASQRGWFNTHSVDFGTCSPCDHSSFASAALMLMHGFLDALPRFEICQGNGLGKEGAR